jgi:hypothetical protein
MKWVTRERTKVDRVACPWLITRFIDKGAEFIFVPTERVLEVARNENAVLFHIPGAELTHYARNGLEYLSFGAIMKKHGLKDSALLSLAKIVRGADAHIPDPPPESAGLEAAATGFRELARDDFENMKLQFPLYDALYRYCQLKTHRTA